MAASFESNTVNFQQVLGQAVPVVVPQYQRNYSWEREHVELLWRDMRESWEDERGNLSPDTSDYFLGTIVTIPGALGKPMTLLDGQQRLATITVVLSTIRDRLEKLALKESIEAAETIQRTFVATRASLEKFQLTLSAVDRDFFAATIQKSPPERIKPKLQSHRLIATARRVSDEQLDELLDGLDAETQFSRLTSIIQGLADHIWLVNVTVRDEDEAGRVFEILNARGIELSVADLLRNFLVSRDLQENRPAVALKWDSLIRDFGGIDLSTFIRHSWMSRYGDVSKKRAYTTIKHEVNELRLTSFAYIDELSVDAEVYLGLTDVSRIERGDRELSDLIFGLNALRARQALPLLLAVTRCCEPELKRTLRRVNALTFQYSVLGKNPNDLEDEYSELARAVQASEQKQEDISQVIYDGLRDFANDMDVFAKEFAKFETGRTDLQRYVLWELEKQFDRHKGLEMSDPRSANVEHIYPQSPMTPMADHEDYINRIGNLTLLAGGPNREIQNKEFAEKQGAYGASVFKITSKLAALSEWTSGSIEARQAELAEGAKSAWKFE